MNHYDLLRLNDREFEDLCNDLYEREHGGRLERFKPGKDQGIDGRYFSNSGITTIVQSKRYQTDFSTLHRCLIREREKMEKIAPEKYILYTSLPLSPRNKDKILETFQPYIQKTSDIYGEQDIVSLISKSRNIEEKYYKLWISGTSILCRVLHGGILIRSENLIADILSSEQFFVETTCAKNAKEKIQNKGCVILTGTPGAGKTTIAKHLCAWSSLGGFSTIEITKPEEAFEVWQSDEKQIFYFDDFLGSNYLSLLTKDASSEIVRLIDAVGRDTSKRFVLTTRSVILNSAKQATDVFLHHNSEIYELEVCASKISDKDKARILYAHVHSRLTKSEHLEAFYQKRGYISVVRHRNYNPRVIEFITTPERLGDGTPEEIAIKITQWLAEPKQIWGAALRVQAHPYVRLLAELACLAGEPLTEELLQDSFEAFLRSRSADEFKNLGALSFYDSSKLAAGSLLSREITSRGAISYRPINPSISDYVFHYRAKEPSFIGGVISVLRLSSAVKNLRGMVRNNITTLPNHKKALAIMLQNIKANLTSEYFDSNSEFILEVIVSCRAAKLTPEREILNYVYRFILQGKSATSTELEFECLQYCLENDPSSVDSDAIMDYLIIELDYTPSEEVLHAAVAIAKICGFEHVADFSAAFQYSVEKYAEDLIEQTVYNHVSNIEDEEELPDAKLGVRCSLLSRITDFGIEIDELFLDDLVDNIDFKEELKFYLKNKGRNHFPVAPRKDDYATDEEIDEIFYSEETLRKLGNQP